ncbi:MAG: tyrosine-type recombinase/integrase [Hyphomicrobiaceae bacterium]
MIGRQAKVFSRRDLRHLRAAAKRGRFPRRDELIVLLAARAGLRACEIARLTWGMVLDPTGKVAPMIEVRASISKRGSGRRVPMHQELRRALKLWKSQQPVERLAYDAVIVPSLRGGGPMRANSIVNWFVAKCREAGLTGCSSHSGRRTFITNAARRAHWAGASLRDVQVLAGHRSIETTQGYIDGDSDAQRRLVALI